MNAAPDRLLEHLAVRAKWEAHAVVPEGRLWSLPERSRPKGLRKMADKACFRNAFLRASERGWRYVEGWALSSEGNVVNHAWAVTAEGYVVETTWRDLGLAYFGAVVPIERVAATALQTGQFGPLLPLSG